MVRRRTGGSGSPELLGELLGSALARTGLDRDLDDYRIMEVWDEVVGPAIARNAQPTRLDDRRLVVTVRNSPWLHELGLLRSELCSRLNERMGRKVISEIFIVVGRLEDTKTSSERGPSARKPASLGPAPDLSGTGLREELAEAFERLWRASHGRRSD